MLKFNHLLVLINAIEGDAQPVSVVHPDVLYALINKHCGPFSKLDFRIILTRLKLGEMS